VIGGAERYCFDLGHLLASKGHKVAYFSTKDSDNQKSEWDKYFVKKLDFNKKSIKNSLEKFPKIFYSFEAKQKISLLLDEFKPDVVHLQNIYYYISPSILSEITKRGIPIIQTVHDYQLISPNVVMYHDGSICEITKKNKYYKAILHKCVKRSYMATLMAIVTLYFQNLNCLYEKSINVFITPSLFMKKKLIEYGINKKRIVHINNFIDAPKFSLEKAAKEKYILYFGRICEAKGIFLLLDAARQLHGVKFKVAGNFEDEAIKSKVLERIKKDNVTNVELLGFKNSYELKELIFQSRFVVVPSLWYENQPYSILESFASGKAVVASRIGGIPEIVHNGKDGFLFEPGDVNQFVQKIKKLLGSPALAKKLGQNAKKFVDEESSPKLHYERIMTIYNSLIA
jgi:glycosyltransferase involved in cell wall biosynthesis